MYAKQLRPKSSKPYSVSTNQSQAIIGKYVSEFIGKQSDLYVDGFSSGQWQRGKCEWKSQHFHATRTCSEMSSDCHRIFVIATCRVNKTSATVMCSVPFAYITTRTFSIAVSAACTTFFARCIDA